MAFKFVNEMLVAGSKKATGLKMCSIDIETHVINKQFLTNERILGIGYSSYNSSGAIETKVFRLKEDNDNAEGALLQQFDTFLKDTQPWICVGFNLLHYDHPLLTIKQNRHRKENQAFWNVQNLLENTFHVELQQQTRFYLATKLQEGWKFRTMAEILSHPAFSNAKLKVPPPEEKSADGGVSFDRIYELWRTENADFEQRLQDSVSNNLKITSLIIDSCTSDILLSKPYKPYVKYQRQEGQQQFQQQSPQSDQSQQPQQQTPYQQAQKFSQGATYKPYTRRTNPSPASSYSSNSPPPPPPSSSSQYYPQGGTPQPRTNYQKGNYYPPQQQQGYPPPPPSSGYYQQGYAPQPNYNKYPQRQGYSQQKYSSPPTGYSQQGYSQRGYPSPSSGYSPQQQGYSSPQQGYAPQQGYPPRSYSPPRQQNYGNYSPPQQNPSAYPPPRTSYQKNYKKTPTTQDQTPSSPPPPPPPPSPPSPPSSSSPTSNPVSENSENSSN